jgi:hypothetical protein
MSALSSLNTEAWTVELRQIQSAATFQRLELERSISFMRTQVLDHNHSRTNAVLGT